MNRNLQIALLALRLLAVWTFALTVVSTLLGALLGDGPLGLGVGCLFLPFLASVLAVWGTVKQVRSCARIEGCRSLSAFHAVKMQLNADREAVEGELSLILQDDLQSSECSLQAGIIHARFGPPQWRGKFSTWAESDEVGVEILDSSPSHCLLELHAGALSRIWCGGLWVDGGRNFKRLQKLQSFLMARFLEADRQKEAARKADSLEGKLAQAELLLLRAQVEPHFLFNTLAHLRELIRVEDCKTALAMLDGLITYARGISSRIRHATQKLEQELEVVRGYLELVQLRLGDRLDFEIETGEGCLEREVPVGCLLIPVENAIKHGIEPQSRGGRVQVRGRLEGDTLCLDVLDDGPGLSMTGNGGTGLSNLRERLKLLYESAFRLNVETLETGGVRVEIRLPANANFHE